VLPFALLALIMGNAGCSGTECGEGTVEVSGVCVPSAGTGLVCGAGFKANGNACVPSDAWVSSYCDPKTSKYDEKSGMCIGTGTTGVTCTESCPSPSGGTICVSGRIFDWTSFVSTQGDKDTSTAVTNSDSVVIKVYDLTDVISVDKPSPIENGTGGPDKNGCFIFKTLQPPFTGYYMISVEDKDSSTSKYAFLGNAIAATSSGNTTDAIVLALPKTTVKTWGQSLYDDGSAMLWFRDATGTPVDAAELLQEGKSAPWAEGTPFYFSDDVTKSPYFVTGATKTSKSGVVGVTKCPLKSYQGYKKGCTFPAATIACYKSRMIFAIGSIDCS